MVLLIKGICSSVMFVETLQKKNQHLGGHVVLFMNGVYLNLMNVGSTSEEGEYLGEHLVVFMKMVLLHCGICGKDCRVEATLNDI